MNVWPKFQANLLTITRSHPPVVQLPAPSPSYTSNNNGFINQSHLDLDQIKGAGLKGASNKILRLTYAEY